MKTIKSRMIACRSTVRLLSVAVASASASFTGRPADASPVFNLSLQGRDVTLGQTSYGSTVSGIAAGHVIEYQVVGFTSSVGAIYNATPGGFTITSLTSPLDGANSLRLDLFELTSQQIQVDFTQPTLETDWAAAIDNTPGSIVPRGNGNDDVSAIRPIRSAGNFAGVTADVILTGTFTISTTGTGTNSAVQMRWSTGSGSLHFNGSGLAKFPNLSSETGANPFVSMGALTLSISGGGTDPTVTAWNTSSGNWSAGPWTNGTPNSFIKKALLGSAVLGAHTIAMDVVPTVHEVKFSSFYSYTINGPNSLSLSGFGGTPGHVIVEGGTHFINTNLSLGSTGGPGLIDVGSAGALVLSTLTTNIGGLWKTGAGSLTFGTTGGYAGTITSFDNGAILIGAPNAISGSLSLGGPLYLNGNSIAISSITASGISTNVHLNSGATLTVNSGTISSAIDGTGGLTVGTGTLTIGITNSYSGATTINSGGTLQFSNALGLNSSSQIILNGGTLRFSQDAVLTRSVAVPAVSGSTINTQGFNGTVTTVSGSGPLTKTGSGTLTVTHVRTGHLTVSAGTVKLPAGFGSNSNSILPAIPTFGATGAFDLNDAKLIIQFGTDPAPLAAARAAIIAGRGGTDFANAPWNGVGGINSSKASAAGGGDGVSFAVGYVANSDLPSVGLPSYTLFNGQTVDASSLLIRYTHGADCNLDGRVNTDDVTIVGATYNAVDSDEWFLGDFDYDGICDSDDVTVLGALYDPTAFHLSSAQLTAQFGADFAAAFARGQSMGSNVPEPGTGAILLAAVAALAHRRRKART